MSLLSLGIVSSGHKSHKRTDEYNKNAVTIKNDLKLKYSEMEKGETNIFRIIAYPLFETSES